jgi:3-deoxy-D-manno-octulosonic-acid transferase
MKGLSTAFAYRLVTSLIAPFLPVWLNRRAKQGKEDPDRLSERQGRTSIKRPIGQLVWLHGASVGETQMLRPVINRLLERPDRHVLITSGTQTSAELLRTQLPDRAIHQYVPLDTPFATARFIAHWRPDLAVFAESELWPNLIWTAQRANLPLALINARMSEASLAGWAKRRAFATRVLNGFDLILAADERTSNGLQTFTPVNIPNIGSLKFDAPVLDYDLAERQSLSTAIGDRPVWLAASTHEAEEAVFHAALAAMRKKRPEAYMIWLPRHPDRGAEIAKRLGVTPRSEGGRPTEDVYIMDTLGEMGLALALSKVCVVGGSFHPSLMGHNPLEAARARVPVITGPYHASFVDLYQTLSLQNAVTITDESQIIQHLIQGLSGELDDTALKAHAFAGKSSGALDRTIKELEQLL